MNLSEKRQCKGGTSQGQRSVNGYSPFQFRKNFAHWRCALPENSFAAPEWSHGAPLTGGDLAPLRAVADQGPCVFFHLLCRSLVSRSPAQTALDECGIAHGPGSFR